MALTKEERDRLTLKALQLQQKTRQRKSVLEPYKDWIRDMIETRDMTFRILTHVLQTECGIKITEQSLNEWYRRHIGRPPRSRASGKRGPRMVEEETDAESSEELPLMAVSAPRRTPNTAAAALAPRSAPAQAAPAKTPAKKRLEYNSPDEWSL